MVIHREFITYFRLITLMIIFYTFYGSSSNVFGNAPSYNAMLIIKEDMRVFKKFLHSPRTWIVVAGMLVILLAPAIIMAHANAPAQASGGGYNPTVNVYPNPSSPGTIVDVNGSNYPPNVTVKVYFQTKDNGVITTVTDGGGFFNVLLTLPSM